MLNLIVGFYGDGKERLGPLLTDFFDTVPITGPRTELMPAFVLCVAVVVPVFR